MPPWLDQSTKRLFDICGSIALIVFLAPLMVAIALVVTVTDGGPPVFIHIRIGAGGRPFPCIKFRTMAVDADRRLAMLLRSNPDIRAEWEANRKLERDPRITAIGGLLRKTSLDELPQLFNVLAGHMSLVGPRPIVRTERRRYGDRLPLYERHRPGITGLWQVMGRSRTSYDERVDLDAWYARNRSLVLDIRLLLLTVPAVVRGRGAY
ncbi:MAG: sugar transferase [Azospirillaceae bacterium]